MNPFADAADSVARTVADAPARLGGTRLVCVDGPSGAGKTTFADALRRSLRDAGSDVRLLRMDVVYDGWAGLDAGMRTVERDVVGPLAHGEPGHYRRFDWHAGAFAERREVRPCDVLVIEGVGSWSRAVAPFVSCLVWLSTPPVVRLERGVDRDGEDLRERLLAWHVQEAAMFAREDTRAHADVVVDGVSGRT